MGATFIIGIFQVNVYPDLQMVRQKAPSQIPNPDIEKNNSSLLFLALCRTLKSTYKIKTTLDWIYDDMGLSDSKIKSIKTMVRDVGDPKEKFPGSPIRVRMADFIETMRSMGEEDRIATFRMLAPDLDVSQQSTNIILTKDLGLSNRCTR